MPVMCSQGATTLDWTGWTIPRPGFGFEIMLITSEHQSSVTSNGFPRELGINDQGSMEAVVSLLITRKTLLFNRLFDRSM